MISNEEVEYAKDYDILDLARQLGLSPSARTGRTCRDMDSPGLVYYPETKSYYDFYEGRGGDTIKLVREYLGGSFSDAVRYITGLGGRERIDSADMHGSVKNSVPSAGTKDTRTDGGREQAVSLDTAARENSAPAILTGAEDKEDKSGCKDFALPERNSDERRLYAYLSKTRHIDDSVIRRLLHEHLIYESADRHNVVFVCRDVCGAARHAMLRGTASDVVWRGDAAGGDKQHYGFSVPGTEPELIVFEAPIDLMSYMSIYPDTKSHLLALGNITGTSIDRYLSEHPEIRHLSMLLDNDRKGYDGMIKLRQRYKALGYVCDVNKMYLYMAGSNVKDMNEYLCLCNDIGQAAEKNPAETDKKIVSGAGSVRKKGCAR